MFDYKKLISQIEQDPPGYVRDTPTVPKYQIPPQIPPYYEQKSQ
jgi:hypothetical protein